MNRPLVATRLTAEETASLIEAADEAERRAGATISEARAVIEQARQEAERVRQMVAEESARRKTALSAIAAHAVDEYLDTKRIEAAAIANAGMIHDAGAIRREFEALTPWLVDFLRAAIERLVGRLDDEDLISRLVAEGVAALKDAHALTIRVHPDALAQIEAARAAHPLRFAAVTAVRADASLPTGAIALEGEGGVMNASLETQIALLCRELEALE